MEKQRTKSGTLEDYLYKDERNNISKVVSKEKKNSKFAKLDYEVLKYNEVKDLSLVKVNLHTGRHHQIRVQLANFGHSIFGDQKYGTRGKGKQIALWAYELTIVHPITKEEMTFKDLPEPTGTWCILNQQLLKITQKYDIIITVTCSCINRKEIIWQKGIPKKPNSKSQ